MFIHTSRIGVFGLAAAASLALMGAEQADAAVLSANTANAMPAYTGTLNYQGDLSSQGFPSLTMQATLDFAVYAPGQFGLTFPGQDPSAGTEYVYAYQITNLDSPIDRMTVGLDGDEPASTPGWISDGLYDPATTALNGSPAVTSVGWDFSPALPGSTQSAILFFTNPAGPEWDFDTIASSNSSHDTHNVPSPAPEPASLALIALGLGFMTKRSITRK